MCQQLRALTLSEHKGSNKTIFEPNCDCSEHNVREALVTEGIDRIELLTAAEARKAPREPSPDDLFSAEFLDEIVFELDDDNDTIAGVLPEAGLAVIHGKPKTKKSFVVDDWAMSVARGALWAGRGVTQGPVVIVAGEGGKGRRKRLVAYRKRHNVEKGVPLILIVARPNLGTRVGDRVKLNKSIEAALAKRGLPPPRLIIVDTLSSVMGGEDQNKQGMSNFIDNCLAIVMHFGCLVLAVHHEPWSAERLRGNSELPGAVDAIIHIVNTGKLEAQITITDAKDDEDGLSFRVTFERFEFGEHPKLKRPVSTLVAATAEPVSAEESKVTDKPRKVEKWEQALPILLSTLADFPTEPPNKRQYPTAVACTRIDLFRRELEMTGIIKSDAEDPKTKEGSLRKAFSRIRDDLQDRKLYCERDKLCWHPEGVRQGHASPAGETEPGVAPSEA
jgi:RecA-family ATPase